MSVRQETTPVIAVLPALILLVAMSVNVTLVTQEMVFLVQTLMSVPLGVQSVIRMQIVMTQQAAMSVPASLATLVMDIHVGTLMSVLLILVMRMQLVPTLTEAILVIVTMVLREMDLSVLMLMNVLKNQITAPSTVIVPTLLVATCVSVSVDIEMKGWGIPVPVK
jgi:hypothetical protein